MERCIERAPSIARGRDSEASVDDDDTRLGAHWPQLELRVDGAVYGRAGAAVGRWEGQSGACAGGRDGRVHKMRLDGGGGGGGAGDNRSRQVGYRR